MAGAWELLSSVKGCVEISHISRHPWTPKWGIHEQQWLHTSPAERTWSSSRSWPPRRAHNLSSPLMMTPDYATNYAPLVVVVLPCRRWKLTTTSNHYCPLQYPAEVDKIEEKTEIDVMLDEIPADKNPIIKTCLTVDQIRLTESKNTSQINTKNSSRLIRPRSSRKITHTNSKRR